MDVILHHPWILLEGYKLYIVVGHVLTGSFLQMFSCCWPPLLNESKEKDWKKEEEKSLKIQIFELFHNVYFNENFNL